MNATLIATSSVALAFVLLLGGLAVAKSLVTKNVTQTVTVVRVNGQNVTQDVGRVLSWSLTNGEMRLLYESDSVFRDGFGDEAR